MNRIHLILPVHHGGKLFSEALRSVAPFAALFDEILVSVNSGWENEVDLAIINELVSHIPNLHVIVHDNETPAPTHFWRIVQSTKFSSFQDTDSVLLFFDDDLFLGGNLQRIVENKLFDPSTIIIGEWQITKDKRTFQLGHAGIGDGMSPSTWIQSMGFRGFRFTNGSGMVVPVKVLREYSRWARHSRKGARFEYFMCTHRSIKWLIPSIPPIVQIYQHSGQEGANVHPIDAAWDEVLYQLWLFRQGRRNSIRSATQGVTLALAHSLLFFFRVVFRRRKVGE